MNDPVLHALERFKNGYSCSQSILMAYAPQYGLSQEISAKIASPFGGGISRSGETCGAVIGALMVLGLKYGPETDGSKEKLYQVSLDFLNHFKSEFSSTQCKQLIKFDLSQSEELQAAREANVFRSICPELVKRTAEILETFIEL